MGRFQKKREQKIKNNSSQAFELAHIDANGLIQKGYFRIIQDDCNDMTDVLQDLKTLNSPLMESVLLNIQIITGRFYYTMGYHRLKSEEYVGRKKGGNAPKMNSVILDAVKKFILTNPKRINEANFTIANTFQKTHKDRNPIEIKLDSVKYEVYCDGGKIISSCLSNRKDKYHEKSIAYSTFLGRYISKAKSEIKPSNSHNT